MMVSYDERYGGVERSGREGDQCEEGGPSKEVLLGLFRHGRWW